MIAYEKKQTFGHLRDVVTLYNVTSREMPDVLFTSIFILSNIFYTICGSSRGGDSGCSGLRCSILH